MSLKDILVCLDASDAGEVRLRLAAQLAQRHKAHLFAVYVVPDDAADPSTYPANLGGLGIGAPVGAVDMAQGALVAGVPAPAVPAAVPRGIAQADIVEQRFREGLGPHGIQGDWHPLGERDAAELVELAKSVDLVVIGQSSPDIPARSGFRPEDIVELCGRPLLVIPYAGTFATLGRRVLIAWDGTREATRALHDALPLIEDAEAATVMTVRAQESAFEHDHAGLERIVRHLERHGIPAKAEESLRGDLAVSDVLLSRAADLGADLIVSGAYHHSQLREALVGGVSRELLDHMTLPVLMSH